MDENSKRKTVRDPILVEERPIPFGARDTLVPSVKIRSRSELQIEEFLDYLNAGATVSAPSTEGNTYPIPLRLHRRLQTS